MKLLRIVPDNTKFGFMRFRRFSFPFSAIASIVSVVAFLWLGLNVGIDFKGGTVVELQARGDRANVALTVLVLRTADQKARLLRVLAPLGVLLPSGLGLRIDNTDVGRAGFVRCLPNGCVAEVVLDDTLIDQMRKGENATFIIFQTPEEGIGIPLSLKGFGDGFDKLP